MPAAILVLAFSNLLWMGLLARTFLKLRALQTRFKPVLDVDAERQRVLASIERAQSESAHRLASERTRVAAELAREREASDASIRGAKAHLERTRVETQQALALARHRVAAERVQHVFPVPRRVAPEVLEASSGDVMASALNPSHSS
ncbi:hypothetical protein [Myxococcus landrumensis]|uniref:Uncharacterized protein n=1 Tax=Myxococcus landrumensis TaxID=2813577 RepID=A0ABX7N3X2_9BACT|nr:hypothetical protein [Myxococcus landrumus]QSQ13183.1 hypothetical protein JY572_33330 [Myxococcus landrumus]